MQKLDTKKIMIASYVTDELFNAIDEQRGNISRSKFIEIALEGFTSVANKGSD